MIDIDRPLEEIILEKRKEQIQQRQKQRTKLRGQRRSNRKSDDAVAARKDVGGDVQMADVTEKPSGGIRKKRRNSASSKVKLSKSKEVQAANTILVDAGKSFKGRQATNGTKKAAASQSAGAKITITNLDPGVSNIDVSELFGAIGTLRRALVMYDNHGRSTGIAEVVYEKMDDALEAIKKYNGVPLDNRPLQISLATSEKGPKGGSNAASGFWGSDRNTNTSGNQNPFTQPLPNDDSGFADTQGGGRGRYPGRRGRRRYNRARGSRDTMMTD